MNKSFILAIVICLVSCKKNASTETESLNDTLQKIDSINAARTKYNDSIKILNNKNRFGDLSGKHRLSYRSDDFSISGSVNFSKKGRDQYDVSGIAKSKDNFLSINGTIKRVSEKHLNFEGKIDQKINGSAYTRTKETTFKDEGKGNFWRLQNKVNGDGFVDYIDIFK